MRLSTLESWPQIELPHPALLRVLERADVVDFGHREAEEIGANRRADAGHLRARVGTRLADVERGPGHRRGAARMCRGSRGSERAGYSTL